MKRPFWTVVLLMGTALPCLGQTQLGGQQRWIEQADAGFVFPYSKSASADYGAGVGGDLSIGYRFNRDINLSADLGYYNCGLRGGGGQWSYLPGLLILRFNFGEGWVRPYLILGGGWALNVYSPPFTPSPGSASQVQVSPMVSPGVGLLFVLFHDLAVYGQVRFDMDYASPGGSWSDNPTVFMPLKAGLSFFAF